MTDHQIISGLSFRKPFTLATAPPLWIREGGKLFGVIFKLFGAPLYTLVIPGQERHLLLHPLDDLLPEDLPHRVEAPEQASLSTPTPRGKGFPADTHPPRIEGTSPRGGRGSPGGPKTGGLKRSLPPSFLISRADPRSTPPGGARCGRSMIDARAPCAMPLFCRAWCPSRARAALRLRVVQID